MGEYWNICVFLIFSDLPYGFFTHGNRKIPYIYIYINVFFNGKITAKSSTPGGFSIAMFDYRMVNLIQLIF